MSLEQVAVPRAIEARAANNGGEYENKHARHAEALGKRALDLDGFMILGEVRSPYEDVREQLMARVVDQPAAIDAIIEAIERSGVRLAGDNRPIANLAFLGPTGVGKSETAKTLASLMNGGAGNLIKVDCSSYSHGHEVLALTGSPPSYVGHQQTPQFSPENIEQPGTVVLFDEIEKGSVELYDLMLQIMGDGELRLNNGENVSFRETIVVLTSNLGAKEMADRLTSTPLGFIEKNRPTDKDGLEKVAHKSFTDFFKPEFTNRLSKVVVFHPLGEEALGKVLDVKLAQANDEYEKRYGVRLSLSDATKSHLVSIAAQEPHLGARPLVRALEDNVQTTFGRYNSGGSLPEGTHVRVIHRSELPNESYASNSDPLVFTAKPDASIRKQVQPLAIEAAPETCGEQEYTEPEAVEEAPEEDPEN